MISDASIVAAIGAFFVSRDDWRASPFERHRAGTMGYKTAFDRPIGGLSFFDIARLAAAAWLSGFTIGIAIMWFFR